MSSSRTFAASAASIAVVIVTFVALLGGTHPGDHQRDVVLSAAAVLFIFLNVPAMIALATKARVLGRLAMLIARIGFAIATLNFVHGISHEHGHDAWRSCRGGGTCAFMRMCANEAPMTTGDRALLLRRIQTEGCAAP